MNKAQIIENTIAFVKETLAGAEAGHDYFHVERVYKNTLLIAKDEEVDDFVVAMAALLHDIADSKFHDGDETVGPRMAKEFMQSQAVDEPEQEHVVKIIENMSFKKSLEQGEVQFNSKELQVVQDADRLDAIGAIGVARAFNYGGYKNRGLYDPSIPPNLNMTKEEYKNTVAPTINHFYEKLLLVKDKMNTTTGKRLAEQRHQFLEEYLEQFYAEWNGER